MSTIPAERAEGAGTTGSREGSGHPASIETRRIGLILSTMLLCLAAILLLQSARSCTARRDLEAARRVHRTGLVATSLSSGAASAGHAALLAASGASGVWEADGYCWPQPRGCPSGNAAWGEDVVAPFEEEWRVHTGREFFAGPALADGVLYIGCNDGFFRAIDCDNGAEVWRMQASCGFCGEACVDSATVYVGGQDGYLYALDRRTGSRVWSAGLGYHVFAGVALFADSLVATGNSAGSVAALERSTGEVVWSDSPGGVILGPAVCDSVIVFTSESGRVVAYDRAGQRLWSVSCQGVASAPSIAGGRVFVGFSDGSVRCFDMVSGEQVWARDLTSAPLRAVLSRPAIMDDHLFLGTCDSRLVCLGTNDGELLWELHFENWMQVPPAVAETLLYIPGDDQRLHVIDWREGTKLDSLEIGGYAGSPPLLVGNRIYLGTAMGDLMALGGSIPLPPDTVPSTAGSGELAQPGDSLAGGEGADGTRQQ
ncbi:PQQ-binding-like beta-propeller repeat protein [Candidatus Fermentibacterales bacterium]|nr:PQQ-binding-like beta-propeller repeat protein [Candidatus Fermentibacterales bacterium]